MTLNKLVDYDTKRMWLTILLNLIQLDLYLTFKNYLVIDTCFVPVDRITADKQYTITAIMPSRNSSKSKGTHAFMLYHNITSSHTARFTIGFLEGNHIKEIEHPSYSLDLAMGWIWLFFRSKINLRGHHFYSEYKIAEAIKHTSITKNKCLKI